MRYIPLGKTGLTVSELGFGGIPIIRLNEDEAVTVLRRAYESGITLFDTANAYRDSEKKMGHALGDVRDKVIFATKTIRRDATGALQQLENSLQAMKTDYIDIYQFHQIGQEKDWDRIAAPGGSMEAMIRAKDQVKIRYIGITSHNLEMAIKLVKTGLFSTVQFPFNFIEDAAKDELFAAARDYGMGILAMKPFGGGIIDNAEIAFRFLRQYPDVIALAGFDASEKVDEVVSYIRSRIRYPKKILNSWKSIVVSWAGVLSKVRVLSQPCPQGVMITAAMNYKVLVSRMS